MMLMTYKAWQTGKTLDPKDFSINGYPVDATKYAVIRKALRKGKDKLKIRDDDNTDVEEDVALGEDDDEEVASSAKADKAGGSARNDGSARDDVSPIQMRQRGF